MTVGEPYYLSAASTSSLYMTMASFSTPSLSTSLQLSLPPHSWHSGGHQHLHHHPGHPGDGHHHRGHLRASPCSCMLLQMCPPPSPDHCAGAGALCFRPTCVLLRVSFTFQEEQLVYTTCLFAILLCRFRSGCFFWAEVWFGC